MDNQVKIIIDKLGKADVNEIKKYVANMNKLIGNSLSLTILDPRYRGDYNLLIHEYDQLSRELPGVKIESFYVSQYLHSDVRDNVNKFTNNYIGDQKMIVEKMADGQRLFKQNGDIRIAIITNRAGRVTAVDFAKPGEKRPHQRVSVNSSGNIQLLRHFNTKTKLPLTDEYLDTELVPQLVVHFDERGRRSDYQLLRYDEPVVYDEVGLYQQWFDKVINSEDYVINLNRHYDVLFESSHDVKKVFLM
ncbi:hypothetical protein PWO95_03580 [Weissella paramesenteroides]|uniref:hypothetical protein n=1 Tax=Weissella paramesenteroides TaxID=1249 RepID=UPI0023A9E02C|nr:hypothetical protein [Weissella paramesenteroides]WEA53644.1 hypothetical protein PWO95_03580 [Weissella paramesenteroides]